MRKFLFALIIGLFSQTALHADSVILMIGDGMGLNHIKCVGKENNLLLNKLPVTSMIKKKAADSDVTDSAAAATAYACGVKTDLYRVAMTSDKKPCESISEKAFKSGRDVYLISTDVAQGGTCAPFYTHSLDRYREDEILADYQKAKDKFYMDFNVPNVADSVAKILPRLKESKKEYFVMIEGAKIDYYSHFVDLKKVSKELADFDKAVQMVWEFAQNQKNVHVFVTADHETGGLNDNCEFADAEETTADVPLYAFSSLDIDKKSIDNTKLHSIMSKALFLNQ